MCGIKFNSNLKEMVGDNRIVKLIKENNGHIVRLKPKKPEEKVAKWVKLSMPQYRHFN